MKSVIDNQGNLHLFVEDFDELLDAINDGRLVIHKENTGKQVIEVLPIKQ